MGVRAHHRDRQRRRYPPHRVQQLEPCHARHVYVGHHQIPALGRRQPERDGRIRGVGDVELAPVG
jgi:hypothetical protein